MRLPRYGEYKDSGAAWLGAIPEHWALVQSRRYFKSRNERARDTDEQLTASQKHGVLYQADFMQQESQKVTQVILGADILKHVEPNDFVISMRSFQGGIEWSGFRGCISSAYVMLVPNEAIYAAFYGYLFKSKPYIQALQATTNLVRDGQALRFSNFAQVALPLVPMGEQKVIALFLDRETAKIDALIAEQEKLITLLAEKRQATISHAVTRGLNPDAPMKDSGVAWLGEVPAHWLTGKIQSFARRESGHTPSRQHPEYWENCTIPWFSLADVWQIREGSIQYVYETKEKVSELGIANSSARVLPAGTVMLSRTASVGYSAIMGCDMATTQDFINWVCGPLLKPEFLLHVLRGMRPEFDRLMMGSTHQTIYMPDVAKLMMTLPPLIEQEAIVAFADDETAKLNALTLAAERATALLKERRSALIAAAVTGQIDVRGTMPPPPSPEESTA